MIFNPVYKKVVTEGAKEEIELAVTPSADEQVLTPDEGKTYGKVTVEAVPTEQKEVSVKSTVVKTVTPSEGKFLDKVTVRPMATAVTYTASENGTVKTTLDKMVSTLTVSTNVPSDAKTEEEKTVTLDSWGETEITPDTEGNVLSKVIANVIGQRMQQSITANGTQTIEFDDPVSELELDVDVPTSEAKEEETKSVSYTSNGTYTITPTDGKTISKATVRVTVQQNFLVGSSNVTLNAETEEFSVTFSSISSTARSPRHIAIWGDANTISTGMDNVMALYWTADIEDYQCVLYLEETGTAVSFRETSSLPLLITKSGTNLSTTLKIKVPYSTLIPSSYRKWAQGTYYVLVMFT